MQPGRRDIRLVEAIFCRFAPPLGALVLGLLFAVPSALVLLVAVRMAFDAETDPGNQ